MQYEKRVVCFMDILGFKSMILNSANDAALRDRIYECLNETKRINEHFRLIRLREKYLTDSHVQDLVTTEDILFSSSSAAADFVLGYSVSGPKTWKANDGRSLKEVEDSKSDS